jgi:tight adherence protein B
VKSLIHALAAFAMLLLYEGLTAAPASRPRRGVARPVEVLAHESGVAWATAPRLFGLAFVAALAALVVVAGVTGALAPALACAAGAAWSPFAVVRARVSRRRKQLRETWPDVIATLVAGVRAGVSLPESCAALGLRGPTELQHGWQSFAATYRATGSFVTALERVRSELADPIADRVVVALRLAHEVGGTDLVRLLRTLGDFVREDLRVRKEIEARWSWTVTAARVAAGAPWIVLLLMSMRPEAAAAYNSSVGVIVIAGGVVATAVGYRLMLQAARLPEDARLGS